MRARLLKEARALLPAWVATLGLVLLPAALLRWAPSWASGFPPAGLGFVFVVGLALGPLLLSSTAFGREFENGTFALLLSQPASRWRLWWDKTSVLGLALATFFGALLLAASSLGGGRLSVRVFGAIFLAAYGGGLLGSLLVRQTLGGVCLGAVVPFLLFVILSIMEATRHPRAAGHALTAPVSLWVWGAGTWAAVSYAAALLVFRRWQDRAPSPGLRPLGLRLRATGRGGGRVSPWRALVWKELHLQQWSLYLELALPLLTLLILVLEPLRGQRGVFVARGAARVTLAVLSVAVPALVGLTAVAEERRMGSVLWQRTMPVSHWHQFGLKLGVAWALALLCTPWLPLVNVGGFADAVAIVSALVALTLFASSLARHVVEALAVSVVGWLLLVTNALLNALTGGFGTDSGLWPGWLTLFATAGVLVVLAGWNTREVTVERRRFWVSLAAVLVVFALARTAFAFLVLGRPLGGPLFTG